MLARDLVVCDCCGLKKPEVVIATVIAYGIETHACKRCRGFSQKEEDDIIKDHYQEVANES